MSFLTENIPGTPLKKSRTPQILQGTLTQAQLNAGYTVPGLENRTVQLQDFRFKMNGTFGGLTDMRLQTTEATPTVALTIPVAGMGDAVIHTVDIGTHTLAAAFWTPLPRGTGLAMVKTGAAATGGTSIDYTITYLLDS